MNTDEALFKNKKMANAYQYREPNVEVNPLIGSSVHILIFFLFFSFCFTFFKKNPIK